jgi:hypothetical protein
MNFQDFHRNDWEIQRKNMYTSRNLKEKQVKTKKIYLPIFKMKDLKGFCLVGNKITV